MYKSDMARGEPSFKVVCISLYPRDLQRMERLVTELRNRGHERMSRSKLIRMAIAQFDADNVE